MNIAQFLLSRLKSLGVDHVFGIPGDYILPLFETMVDSEVQHVAACNELNAGYATDGYARLKGLGAVAVTYGPGSFSLVNAVASAYAERTPLVVISGGPAREKYISQPHMHHILPGRWDASLKIFAQVTVQATRLTDPQQAVEQIDAALQICQATMRPVFLEIPMDLQMVDIGDPPAYQPGVATGDEQSITDALDSITRRLTSAKRPVVLVGHEIHSAQLQDKVIELVQHNGLAVGSMFTGKADFLEQIPECLGVYHGAGSLPDAREFVEDADAVLFLGAVDSDFNMGGSTAKLSSEQMIHVFDEKVRIDGQQFDSVPITAVVDGLLARLPGGLDSAKDAPVQSFPHNARNPYDADAHAPITNKRIYDRLAHFIRPRDIVLADAGCSINMAYVQLPADTRYITSAYWASIGMGFGATFGACFAAEADQRVIAVEGDGAFQMTAQELSSMVRYKKTPIVIVVNNKGYTAERLIHDGPFNDIPDWRYHLLPVAYGGVEGEDVHSEGDLENALARAETFTGPGPLVIEIHIDPFDASEAFKRMSEGLRHR